MFTRRGFIASTASNAAAVAGGIDMKAVIAVAKKTGVVQCHVEQDQSPNPLASIALSMTNLPKM